MAGALPTAKDPWASIRQLHFGQYDQVHQAIRGDAEAGHGDIPERTEKLWGVNQDALQAGGFNSKYQRVEEVDPVNQPGLFRVVVQQPGAHKYDTADVFYRVDPETGMGTMVDDPNPTRQTSSKDKFQDKLEKRILPIAAGVLGAGAALGAAGYGAGLGGFTGGAGAAAPGAAGAMSAEQAAFLAANAPVGNAGGLAAWAASPAGQAVGAAGAAGAAGSTGNAIAKAATDIAGSTGMNWLDTALSAGKSVFGNDWLSTAMSLVGSGVNQYNIEKAAKDQRDWLDSKDTDRRRRQAPGALPAMKTTVYTKGGG